MYDETTHQFMFGRVESLLDNNGLIDFHDATFLVRRRASAALMPLFLHTF